MTSQQPYWNGGHASAQTNSMSIQLFSYVNTFFCSNKLAWLLAMWMKTLCTTSVIFFFSIFPSHNLVAFFWVLLSRQYSNLLTKLASQGSLIQSFQFTCFQIHKYGQKINEMPSHSVESQTAHLLPPPLITGLLLSSSQKKLGNFEQWFTIDIRMVICTVVLSHLNSVCTVNVCQ